MMIKNSRKGIIRTLICFLLTLGIIITVFPISAEASNPFSRGQCTWWAYERLTQMNGKEPPVISGNAGGWYNNCLAAGLTRGSTPTVGAIACWNNGQGNDSGHVAIVEAVYSDHIHISEYNWDVSLGYNEKDLYFSNMNRSSSSKPNRYFAGYIYVNQRPRGNVDGFDASDGKIHVVGWAFDDDTPD